MQVGNWFPLPPVHAPTFPLLVVGQPPLAPQEEVLAVVQEVQRGRHGPVPPTLTSIFAGDRFPSFFAELDPYQAERTEPVWDPPELLTPLPPARSEQSFFDNEFLSHPTLGHKNGMVVEIELNWQEDGETVTRTVYLPFEVRTASGWSGLPGRP